MIRGLWDCQVDTIIYFKLGDTDAETYKHKPMTKFLERWDNINKDKHGTHCNYQGKHCPLFVMSVDRLLGREALIVISQLSQVMAEKMEETLSKVRGWVNRHIDISVARSYSSMIRRYRLPSPLREQEPD